MSAPKLMPALVGGLFIGLPQLAASVGAPALLHEEVGFTSERIAERVESAVLDPRLAVAGDVHGKPDWWGRRQYAYPINKKEYGYYVVYQLLAPGGALDDLERSFRIADDIVRHKLIRLPDSEAARRGLTETAA